MNYLKSKEDLVIGINKNAVQVKEGMMVNLVVLLIGIGNKLRVPNSLGDREDLPIDYKG